MYPFSPYAQAASTSSPPAPGPYDFPNSYRSYGDTLSFPTDTGNAPLSNPLPEPPRQSLYSTTSTEILRQIATAPSIADSDQEYWNVFAGIAPARAWNSQDNLRNNNTHTPHVCNGTVHYI